MAPNQVQFSLAGDIWLSDLREYCWCLGGQARMLLDIFSVRLTLYTESLIQSFQLCCGWETLYYIKQLRCFHPSVYPSIYSSMCISIHPLIYWSYIHSSIHIPSTQPPIHLSINHSSNMDLPSTHNGSCRWVLSCSHYCPENWIWLLNINCWLSCLLSSPENILFSLPTTHQASAFYNCQYFSFVCFITHWGHFSSWLLEQLN